MSSGKATIVSLLKNEMSLKEQLQWIENKTASLEYYATYMQANLIKKGFQKKDELGTDSKYGNPIHDVFYADDEEFDPKLAGRMVNDYELELMKDLEQYPQARLYYRKPLLSLCTASHELKVYELEYIRQFLVFVRKGLITESAQDSGYYTLNERGRRTLEVAKDLEKKEVEQWEAWRGMPSLYQWNDRIN